MLRFITLAFVLITFGQLSAQTCVRDSSVLDSMELVSPQPYSPADPTIYTLPACINEPYAQSVTFNVPPMITFNGVELPLSKITVAPTGAVAGLPAGLGYSCDPPNCEFLANTLGCMLISGTPTPNNAPQDYELTITVTAYSLVTIPIEFPGTIAAGNKYYITVRGTGECTSGTSDLSGQIAGVKNAPNPFGQQTEMIVESLVAGDFNFEVFNVIGKRVNQQTVQLIQGTNQFTFDAGNLPNGTYFYTLGNREGNVSNTFVINR